MMLRQATRIMARAQAPMMASCARAPAPAFAPLSRNFATRSQARLGHNLEDHYDCAEYVMAMQGPMPEYVVGTLAALSALVVVLPLLHSNYYFTGRFVPKDQGNTQLCDDSW
eukprot:GEMP01078359.1.p3 GENE.GEMP01078359.1~~GEMP01078359.1.p3  ORF type:complete len:112 (+),score=14.96 GEMP01078359.1:53-388(+)